MCSCGLPIDLIVANPFWYQLVGFFKSVIPEVGAFQTVAALATLYGLFLYDGFKQKKYLITVPVAALGAFLVFVMWFFGVFGAACDCPGPVVYGPDYLSEIKPNHVSYVRVVENVSLNLEGREVVCVLCEHTRVDSQIHLIAFDRYAQYVAVLCEEENTFYLYEEYRRSELPEELRGPPCELNNRFPFG